MRAHWYRGGVHRLRAVAVVAGVAGGVAAATWPACGAAAPGADAGEVAVSTTEALAAALRAAKPGTTILVAPGRYGSLSAAGVAGAPGAPVRVRAADRADPPCFTGTVYLQDPSWVELEDLRVEGAAGNGFNLDDGGTFESPAHHLVLRRLGSRDCGGAANADGIKLSGVQDFLLEECTVERWGRKGSAVDMVGCMRGELRGCTFRDREEGTASSGVQAKGGSSDIVIRRCRFEHAGERAVNLGGSTGMAYFRPRPQGYEAKNLTVEGCTFIGSNAPVAFVGVDGAVVRFNTFLRPRAWFFRVLQETAEPGFVPCRGGRFEDNVVVYRRRELRTPVNVGPGTLPDSFRAARNWWFAEDDPAGSVPKLPFPETAPAGGTDPGLRDQANGDLRLRDDSPARGHGADALP